MASVIAEQHLSTIPEGERGPLESIVPLYRLGGSDFLRTSDSKASGPGRHLRPTMCLRLVTKTVQGKIRFLEDAEFAHECTVMCCAFSVTKLQEDS